MNYVPNLKMISHSLTWLDSFFDFLFLELKFPLPFWYYWDYGIKCWYIIVYAYIYGYMRCCNVLKQKKLIPWIILTHLLLVNYPIKWISQHMILIPLVDSCPHFVHGSRGIYNNRGLNGNASLFFPISPGFCHTERQATSLQTNMLAHLPCGLARYTL